MYPYFLLLRLAEHEYRVPIPQKPDRDGIWASIRSDGRQPCNNVGTQTLLGMLPPFCRYIEHTTPFLARHSIGHIPSFRHSNDERNPTDVTGRPVPSGSAGW